MAGGSGSAEREFRTEIVDVKHLGFFRTQISRRVVGYKLKKTAGLIRRDSNWTRAAVLSQQWYSGAEYYFAGWRGRWGDTSDQGSDLIDKRLRSRGVRLKKYPK